MKNIKIYNGKAIEVTKPVKKRFNISSQYVNLLLRVYNQGIDIQGRNGMTKQLVGESLKISLDNKYLQLINGRPFNYYAVLAEYAALVRGPKHIDDFKRFGCNYWDQFGDKEGNLKLDYGNAWLYNGSLDRVYNKLKAKQFTRDLVINGWMSRPENLTLPCCHFAYQFIKSTKTTLDLVWYQRSADLLVGVPSDMLLAQLMLILFAKVAGLQPRQVTMFFGSAHIYEEHLPDCAEYIIDEADAYHYWHYKLSDKADPLDFVPDDIDIFYQPKNSGAKFKCIK